MKKKIFAALIAASLLVGCSGGTENVPSDVSEEATSESTTEATDEASSDVEEVESATDLYDKFLNNEERVHINDNRDQGEYFTFETNGEQNYTLEELVNTIIAGYITSDDIKIKLKSIEYAYIDCGADGEKELALKISTPMSGEGWIEYLIIKDIEGKLETVYSNVAWSRSSIYINEYGYIYGDGSGGAAYHGFDKSFIDAQGEYHFLYYDYTTGFVVSGDYGGDLWFNGESYTIPATTELPGNYVFFQFDFNNTSDNEADDIFSYAEYEDISDEEWGNGYRGYFYAKLKDDDSIYDSDNPLKAFFDQEGLKIYTIKEIDEMVAQKEAQEGLTETIKNGEEADWKELDYNFEPYIATYNADNFLERLEYFPLSFSLCKVEPGSFKVDKSGNVEGRYSDYKEVLDGNYSDKQNEFTSTLKLISKDSEYIYRLALADIDYVHEPRTTEAMKLSRGSVC